MIAFKFEIQPMYAKLVYTHPRSGVEIARVMWRGERMGMAAELQLAPVKILAGATDPDCATIGDAVLALGIIAEFLPNEVPIKKDIIRAIQHVADEIEVLINLEY